MRTTGPGPRVAAEEPTPGCEPCSTLLKCPHVTRMCPISPMRNGPPSNGATPTPTVPSSTRCGPPACTAGRPAPRACRGARTSVPCVAGRGRAGRLPPVQAMQAGRGSAGGPSRGRGGEGLPLIENADEAPEPRRACRPGRHEPLSLPSRVQGGHRPDAEGLRGGPSRAPGARRAVRGARTVTGRDLRRRLQLQRPLLRGVGRSCSA